MKLRFLSKLAPSFLGAFLFVLGQSSCKKQDDWPGHKVKEVDAAKAEVPQAPKKTEAAPAKTESKSTNGASEEEDSIASNVGKSGPVAFKFMAYNVENWLISDRFVNNKKVNSSPKPEKEKQAVIDIVKSATPDVFGLCEIGTEQDLEEVQKRLTDAGHPMPNSCYVGGSDPTRHLGFLSRYPIIKRQAHENLTYTMGGQQMAMQRGILDVTVDTPCGNIRFLGVHLKSKLDTDKGDQDEIRRNEAHLLRREIDAIFAQDPSTRLVVYGDMNDTRNTPPIREIHKPGKGAQGLLMMPLVDSHGEHWTQYWDYQDIYSRIDYVMLSPSLKRSVLWQESKIYDHPDCAAASDHRPLLVYFTKQE